MPKRCALGCSNNYSYHQFPNPEKNPDRFKAWVHIAGGKLDSQADYELYRKKVICDIHFTDRDRNRNNRLNFLAVPSLHLFGKSDEVGTSEEVLLAPEPVNEESSFSSLKPTQTVNPAGIIASGRNYYPLPNTLIEENQSNSDANSITSEIVLLTPEPVTEESSLATLQPTLTDNSARIIALEHNYYQLQMKAMNKTKNNHTQQEVPPYWLNQLKTTRRKIKILQSNLIRSQKKNKIFKSRIASAQKMSSDLLLEKLTNKMTPAAKIFTKMQYTQTSKKPSGRRFSLEEKMLSLSLYKNSPSSYPLLAKYFTMPAIKSLKKLLTKTEVGPGLN